MQKSREGQIHSVRRMKALTEDNDTPQTAAGFAVIKKNIYFLIDLHAEVTASSRRLHMCLR